jgi:hypothetical protein
MALYTVLKKPFGFLMLMSNMVQPLVITGLNMGNALLYFSKRVMALYQGRVVCTGIRKAVAIFQVDLSVLQVLSLVILILEKDFRA